MRKVLWHTCCFREYIFTIFTLLQYTRSVWLWGCDCELYFDNLLSTLNFLKDLKVNILNRGINTLCFRSFACMYWLGSLTKSFCLLKIYIGFWSRCMPNAIYENSIRTKQIKRFLDKILLYVTRLIHCLWIYTDIWYRVTHSNSQRQIRPYAPYMAGALFCNWGLLMRGRQCQV